MYYILKGLIMKRIKLILLIASAQILACVTTMEPMVTYPAETPTAEAPTKTAMPDPVEPASGAVFELTITARCATVTAAEALHIRSQPNEKASVVGYLHNGEQVIIMRSTGAWWKIRTATVDGYSKAEYLQESECK